MEDFLFKILGFLIGGGLFLGLIIFIIWMFVAMFRGDFYHCWLPWMPWSGGSYKITGTISFENQPGSKTPDHEQTRLPQPAETKDIFLKIRQVPHPAPKKVKQKRVKPEWWCFLTEESIGSLLEKRQQRKASRKHEQDNSWQKYS